MIEISYRLIIYLNFIFTEYLKNFGVVYSLILYRTFVRSVGTVSDINTEM